jgi:hypothetical protein
VRWLRTEEGCMTNSITVRWAGRAATGSTYKIERTTNNSTWATLAAAQPATAPYTSPAGVLDGNASYGAATFRLVDAAAFSAAGWLWLDDALVQWDGKSGEELTGCVWHSGYGVYADGSAVLEAHEAYTDVVTIMSHAVVYRITHIDASGRASAPAHFWYYAPPAPEDSGICVVVVSVGADLGMKRQAGVQVQAYLATDDQFGTLAGQHLDSNAVEANSALTNVFGLAFFHCWKNSARSGKTADAPYTFILKPGPNELKVSASVIPDRDWVLLSQIAD